MGLEGPFVHLDLPATSGHLVQRPTLLEEGMQTYLSATRRLRLSAFSRNSLDATWQVGTLMCPTLLASPARFWLLQEVQGARRRSSFVFPGHYPDLGWIRLGRGEMGSGMHGQGLLASHRYSWELQGSGVLALRNVTPWAGEEERAGKVRRYLHKAPVSIFGNASAWRTTSSVLGRAREGKGDA